MSGFAFLGGFVSGAVYGWFLRKRYMRPAPLPRPPFLDG